MQNAKSLATVERERERESRSLTAIAVLACKKGKISLCKNKPHIIYRAIKKDMKLMHREKLCTNFMSIFVAKKCKTKHYIAK